MPSSTERARTTDSPIRICLNIKDSDKSKSNTMDSPVKIFMTIANNATSTGSPDKLTAPNTETICTQLKKKEEQLKKFRDFTRRMKKRIKSECMEAIWVLLWQERVIEILATLEDLDLIKE